MPAVPGASRLMEVMSQKHKRGLLTGDSRGEVTPELSPLQLLLPVQRRIFILNEEREKRILEESDPMPSRDPGSLAWNSGEAGNPPPIRHHHQVRSLPTITPRLRPITSFSCHFGFCSLERPVMGLVSQTFCYRQELFQ